MNSDFTSVMADERVSAFFEAWQKLRAGKDIPERSDVRLQDFAPFAADLLMYELKSSSDLRCRLMGSRVSERVGIGGPDVNWLELVCPEMRSSGEVWWNNLVSLPCAGLMQFSTGFLDGSNRLSRSLLLPIQQPSGEQPEPKIILMAISLPSGVYRVDEPRKQLIISADCFQAKYLDIGFGLPGGIPAEQTHKTLDEDVLTRLYGAH